MTVSASSAGKRLGETSGWSLTNLEMQKMVYLAHMFHLGQHDSPLVSGFFEAWDYGPVHPELYHRVKIFGADPVEPSVFRRVRNIPEGESVGITLLDNAVKFLSGNSAKLVRITHWKYGAWAKNYQHGRRGVIIENDDIKEEYKRRFL